MITFDYTVMTLQQMNDYLNLCESNNWMQTWAYAKAIHKRDYKSVRPVVILLNSLPAGLMMIHEIHLGPIHFIDLKRGPLWFKQTLQNHDPHTLLKEFACEFNRQYPSGFLKRRRWLPEFTKSKEAENILKQSGFKSRRETFATIHVDLRLSTQELRKNLKQKWRNCLNKAEKQNLQITRDPQLYNVDLFLHHYNQYKNQKKFQGPTLEFLREELAIAKVFKNAFMVWAHLDHVPVAGMLILIHGRSATYRIGWNSASGRTTNAHYLMMWTTILHLKKIGVESFDLGGILPTQEKAMTHFKLGLGYPPTELLGMFE